MTRIISPLSKIIDNNMQGVTEREKIENIERERERTIKDQSSNRQMTVHLNFRRLARVSQKCERRNC